MKNQQSRECQLNILNDLDSNYVKKTRSIYQLSNDKLVLPRSSKFHLKTKDFFFGLPKEQLDKFNWNNLFVLFICDSEKRVFILPATELSLILGHTSLIKESPSTASTIMTCSMVSMAMT